MQCLDRNAGIQKLLDCSQSPIFSWNRLDIPLLTVTVILIFKCNDSRLLPNRPRPLSSFDTHARWQPVTQNARSRWSHGKIENCEQSKKLQLYTTDYTVILQLFLSDEWFMSILNLRNDQNIGKYENIAEWRWLLAKKVQVNTAWVCCGKGWFINVNCIVQLGERAANKVLPSLQH